MQIHDKYKDRNVQFVALTSESAEDLDSIQVFAAQLHVPWPIGYGAANTISQLNIPGIPATFVIGRDGNVLWNSFQSGTLDGAIRKAL